MNKGHEYKVNMDEHFHCKDCSMDIKGKDTIIEHSRKHLRHNMFNEENTLNRDNERESFRKLFNIKNCENNVGEEKTLIKEPQEHNNQWNIRDWLKEKAGTAFGRIGETLNYWAASSTSASSNS